MGSISELKTRIELIEEEKKDFQKFVNSLLQSEFSSEDDSFRDIFKYVNDYPYLFKLILFQDHQLGIEYLQKYFFKSPVGANAVYRSNLSFFAFELRDTIGENNYKNFLDALPVEVKNSKIVNQALEEIE
ncbi:MAG: hypothetical protein P8P74_05605 [Crocinitomicaceae bacterium]|nr:hypothetical protein [Crocinitomicaceae bacterium]